MSPGALDPAVIADRAAWIRAMLSGLRDLPLDSLEDFTEDRHTIAAAESYLRRAVEALVDLGRHILAKRFGVAVSEYKAIPTALEDAGVLDEVRVRVFTKVCGYRNRMVHFYHAISDEELYAISTRHVGDLESILAALLDWIAANPDEGQSRSGPR